MTGFPKRAFLHVALIALVICAGYLTGSAYLRGQALIFYAASIMLSLLLVVAARLWVGNKWPLLRTLALTLVIFAVFLPVADFAYFRASTVNAAPAEIKPVYSYRAAKGDPKAFYAFWKYYTGQWKDVLKTAITREPDPKGVLPFVYVPNSTGKFFDSEVHINNLGFRGKDLPADKGNHYRIFTLGESPTFSGTLHRDDLPWPDVLQKLIDGRLNCDRPIQVVNAGAAAYDLKANIERMRRDILPLSPDMIISYHGINGLALMDATVEFTNPPDRINRGSALLAEVEYRLRLLRFRAYEDNQVRRLDAMPIDTLLRSRLADLYRELIEMARKHHFTVVLANTSTAVTPESPIEVRDFYSRAYTQLRTQMATVATHNRLVREIAERAEVPFIDTTPGIAGNWDSDLFLDPVHFTQKGSNLFAKRILDGIEPLLVSDEGIRCAVTH
jgi:lysophospholipase L1-like esterase